MQRGIVIRKKQKITLDGDLSYICYLINLFLFHLSTLVFLRNGYTF